MISLISMGLAKMFKSLVFRIGIGVMTVYPLLIVLVSAKNKIGHFVLFKRKCKNTTFLE